MIYPNSKFPLQLLGIVLVAITANTALANSCQEIEEYLNMPIGQIEDALTGKSATTLRLLRDSAINCAKVGSGESGLKMNNATPQEEKDKAGQVADAAKSALNSELDLKGFNFAVGLGVMRVSGGDVSAATIDNGVVRVTEVDKQKLGLWLSTSTFFDTIKDSYRWGLFLGAQLGGDDKVLNGLATGIAIASAKKPSGQPGTSPLVFQIGWGWTRVQRLADGYVDGEAPPGGATQPLFKKTTQGGPVLMISYSFL